MTRYSVLLAAASITGTAALAASEAAAQPVGTFRWQLQPYCNVVTVNVTGQGQVFTLDGFDDQCGAGQRASVIGTAFLNPDGTVGLGLNTVLSPGGAFVHLEARVSLASIGGPWRDSAGNNGEFVLTPGAGTGGSPRPVPPSSMPPASITGAEIAAGAVGSAQLAGGSVGTPQVDPNQIQTRVTGRCPAEHTFRAINVDGSVECDPPAAGFRATHSSSTGGTSLSGNAAVIHQISIDVPRAGVVLVQASATVALFGAGPAEFSYGTVVCGLGPTTTLGDGPLVSAGSVFWNFFPYPEVPLSQSRGFDVTPGTHTFRLVCFNSLGSASVNGPSMTALFIPGALAAGAAGRTGRE